MRETGSSGGAHSSPTFSGLIMKRNLNCVRVPSRAVCFKGLTNKFVWMRCLSSPPARWSIGFAFLFPRILQSERERGHCFCVMAQILGARTCQIAAAEVLITPFRRRARVSSPRYLRRRLRPWVSLQRKLSSVPAGGRGHIKPNNLLNCPVLRYDFQLSPPIW